jgi:hypothetical protein
METMLIVIGVVILLLVGVPLYISKRNSYRKKREEILNTGSAALIERIRNVFQGVATETFFSEVYDSESKRSFLNVFEINGVALLVIKAKVRVGYDFSGLEWYRHATREKIYINRFPAADVFSIEPEIQFYDTRRGWLHTLDSETDRKTLEEAREIIKERILESDIPVATGKQIRFMINQLADAMGWEVEIKQEASSGNVLKDKLSSFLK